MRKRKVPRKTLRLKDLQTLAVVCHELDAIKWPGPEGGWATATLNGHDYRAWYGPVPTPRAVETP